MAGCLSIRHELQGLLHIMGECQQLMTTSGWALQAAGWELNPVDGIADLSEPGRSLLMGLLDVDEGRRLSVEEAVQHPWFDEVRPNCDSPESVTSVLSPRR